MRIAVAFLGALAVYYAWRVTQQRGETLPQKLQQAAREIATVTLPPVPPISRAPINPPSQFTITALLDLIARAEANRGYDSYYAGARIPPAKPVSQMTLAEVTNWQARNRAARSVSTAVGRYQFIGDTLAGLVRQTRTPLAAPFNAALQDAFAIQLMLPAGLDRFRAGQMSAEHFAFNLSRIWAGLPRDASGRSYYAGDAAGNRANVTWADLLNVLRG